MFISVIARLMASQACLRRPMLTASGSILGLESVVASCTFSSLWRPVGAPTWFRSLYTTNKHDARRYGKTPRLTWPRGFVYLAVKPPKARAIEQGVRMGSRRRADPIGRSTVRTA
ncbi:MAG TPA: hypothetical protein VHT74_32360 [Acetobacteraceae bacterium]|jgi:hypothetical protein|nr:hypothetical protein [Acetobacteraceae bacterium]